MTYNYRKPIDKSDISDKLFHARHGYDYFFDAKTMTQSSKRKEGETYSLDNQTGGKKNVRV